MKEADGLSSPHYSPTRALQSVWSHIHLRRLHLGPDDLLVGAKIAFVPPDLPSIAAAIDAAEARIRAVVPAARLIYLEPYLLREIAVTEG